MFMNKSKRVSFIGLRSFGASAKLTRNNNFKVLTDKDASVFEGILGSSSVLRDAHEIEPYNSDWTKKYSGNSKMVLKPKSAEQISEVLRYCNE
jgi:hypothetical protein